MTDHARLPQRKRTAATERQGVNYVRDVVERANSLFHGIHGENDYGNDAFIQLVDGEAVTGQYVLIQIKAGRSYCEADACFIPATQTQLVYWNSHKLPVLGIVYDPDENTAYWINIGAYLRGNPDALTSASHRIRISKEEVSRFDDAGFNDFLLPSLLGKRIQLDFERSIRLTLKGRLQLHTIALQSLFYQFRNRLETWEVLERTLRSRESFDTHPLLAYFLAHVPGHGDIVWHKESIIEPDVRTAVKARMALWGPDLLVKLLGLVDDNGFERGTPGQSVYALIDLVIQDAVPKLATIIQDPAIDVELRQTALHLYCLIAQDSSKPLLEDLTATGGMLSRIAGDMLRHLTGEGFFYT